VSTPSEGSRQEWEPDPESVARRILLDQLTGRARSRAELADKLRSRNVPEEVATRLLDRFEQVGLVDDAEFARTWVTQRSQTRGLARRALAQELRRKGVGEEVAAQALEGLGAEAEADAARELVRRRLPATERLDDTVAARRLVGMLARKGYGPGLAHRVVRDEMVSAGRDCP
jgi:regulatory protein